MPTQEILEGSVSGRGAKTVKQFATLAKEAQERAKMSTNAMPTLTREEMSKEEALAVLWTGLEVLARTGQANLYRSPRTGRVVVELLAVELDEKGLHSK